jgi:hypothetical protein
MAIASRYSVPAAKQPSHCLPYDPPPEKFPACGELSQRGQHGSTKGWDSYPARSRIQPDPGMRAPCIMAGAGCAAVPRRAMAAAPARGAGGAADDLARTVEAGAPAAAHEAQQHLFQERNAKSPR